jgi:cobalamin synthase
MIRAGLAPRCTPRTCAAPPGSRTDSAAASRNCAWSEAFQARAARAGPAAPAMIRGLLGSSSYDPRPALSRGLLQPGWHRLIRLLSALLASAPLALVLADAPPPARSPRVCVCVCVCVCMCLLLQYCNTYITTLFAWGEGDSGGHVLCETTSQIVTVVWIN